MTKITARSHAEQHRLGTQFTRRLNGEVRAVMRSIALPPIPTIDDLAVIATRWTKIVDEALLPAVADLYWGAVEHVRAQLVDRAALTSAAPEPDPPPDGSISGADILAAQPFIVADVPNALADEYLAGARNRLVNVGNEVWERARAALLDGFRAGDGIGELAARLGMVPEDYAARAEVIARTEVVSASNIGSLAQISALNVDATKTWLATLDNRTRPTHAAANGQTVKINESFGVAGEYMGTPGDPGAAASNAVNCRCTLTFEILPDAGGSGGMGLGGSAVSLTATIEGVGGHVMTAATTDLGGKPSEGTKKDKRLRENDPKARKTSAALTCPDGWKPDPAGDGCVPVDHKAGDPVSCPAGWKKDPDGDGCVMMSTSEAIALATVDTLTTTPQWRGVLTVEGVPTGDGREFAPNSLTWVSDDQSAPMVLQWQKESSHGGTHDVTVAVGIIDRAWRDGALIMGEGRFDTHPDAVEAYRRMTAGMLNGTSINADDITDADVEYIYPEADADSQEDEDWIELLFAKPEKTIFHAGRIRATTLCDIPAFVEARLSIVDGSSPPAPVADSHSTATNDGAWDAVANEARLPDVLTDEIVQAAYAYVADDATEGRFIHHEISDDGTPGAANLTACQSDIALLHDDDDLSDSAKRGVYNHLAKHLRDAGREVPPFETQHSLVAHAWSDTFRPSASWFRDPGLKVPTPIMISDQGRLYGLATEWAECHLGYMNECILPPRDDDFSRFMTGEQPLDDGTIAAVGVITAGIGHAPLSFGANKAAEHYDNTDSIIAYVTAGNCKLGIWVAGAVLPWAQEARVSALRASGQVSPDWRRIGGKLRMVGLLTVNISGYQVGRPTVRQLVAGGQVRSLIASGFTSVRRPAESKQELDGRALQIISDQLAKRVHPEE